MPPDRISIKDDTGVERSTVVGPYAEGDIITLSCEVFGGKCIYTLFIKQKYLSIYRFNQIDIDKKRRVSLIIKCCLATHKKVSL